MSWVSPDDARYDQARALHAQAGVMDLHVDSIIQQRLFGYDVRKRHSAGFRGQPLIWHADIPRMCDAGYGAICMGVHYWPTERRQAMVEVHKQIDYLDRIADADPAAMRVWTPDDWAVARERGLLGIAPGVEGAHMLNGDLSHVETLARRGIAYLTLTHFSRNAAATPSLGRGANETDALTDFGRQLVDELNHWGIAVDVAHVNTPGVLEACRLTAAPLLCTHTGVRGVHDIWRNLTDREIDAIAETGGVIGLMFASNHMAGRLNVDSNIIADHIDYVVRRVGPRHVCYGSDYDGWVPLPRDQRDVRDSVKVTHALLERGYSEEDVLLILRDNAQRVLEEAWAARKATAARGPSP